MRLQGEQRGRVLGRSFDLARAGPEEQSRAPSNAFRVTASRNSRTIEQQIALQMFHHSRTAALVITHDGRVLHANWQAQVLLRRNEALRMSGDRLTIDNRAANERLSALVRAVADPTISSRGAPPRRLSIARRSKRPLTLLAAPFRLAHDEPQDSLRVAILFIRDPELPGPTSQAIQELFGLTPAEANIASALTDGKSVDAIASALDITLNTARTHLKNIYAKTVTCRQSEVVALLLRSVATMGSS